MPLSWLEKPITASGKALAVGRDDAQVELLERRRIAGGALQDGELRVDRHDRRRRRAARRRAAAPPVEMIIGLPNARHVLQQRRALQVAGGDLEGRHVELGQEVGAGEVERRREEVDAELGRVGLQLRVLGLRRTRGTRGARRRWRRSCSRCRTACRRPRACRGRGCRASAA